MILTMQSPWGQATISAHFFPAIWIIRRGVSDESVFSYSFTCRPKRAHRAFLICGRRWIIRATVSSIFKINWERRMYRGLVSRPIITRMSRDDSQTDATPEKIIKFDVKQFRAKNSNVSLLCLVARHSWLADERRSFSFKRNVWNEIHLLRVRVVQWLFVGDSFLSFFLFKWRIMYLVCPRRASKFQQKFRKV